ASENVQVYPMIEAEFVGDGVNALLEEAEPAIAENSVNFQAEIPLEESPIIEEDSVNFQAEIPLEEPPIIEENPVNSQLEFLQEEQPIIQEISSEVEALFQQGIEQEEAGNFEGALLSFNQTIQLKPDHLCVWFYRGNTLKHLGRLE
ncbi:MAG: hypothetical protein ACKPFF_07880, partial [Planktothrix sp.]